MKPPKSPSSSSSLSHLTLLPLTSDLEFTTLFTTLNSHLISQTPPKKSHHHQKTSLNFLSTTLSPPLTTPPHHPTTTTTSLTSTLKNLSVFERAFIGACAGGSAGAFTYVCLYPLTTVKTKLQLQGASRIYKNTLDVVIKTFENDGVKGFYSGVSAVLVGSTFSSAVYFATCEFGKSLLTKFDGFPQVLIPPTAGFMGNIVSSAIMVPKELVTQRMQAGAKGKSWEVVVKILEKDGVMGLYAGYTATLLRNLPAGVLSYSSFEWLKAAVLRKGGKEKLTPVESVCCGALAGAISASVTTPLDVVKTRLMTQVHGEAAGVVLTIKRILMEEGWVGLTRGMGPRVVHSACFSAIGYFAFETVRLAVMEQYLRHKDQGKEVVVSASL